ncbi:hypothetical protein [Brevundimonas sp.]
MRRIVLTVGLCGLLAACGQEAQPVGPDGAPAQELDFIDAVPIDKDAPLPPRVTEPQTAAEKEEPEETEEEVEEEAEAAPEVTVAPTPAPAATPRPAPTNDAAAATRRANEAVAPRSPTEVPYSPN